MAEEDIKERARDYVERLKVDSLAKAPQHQRAAMAAYWQSRAGMFRALAKMVIKAELADRDEAGALAWAVGEFAKELQGRAATGTQFREFQRWTSERAGFLHTIAREIWRLILRDQRTEPAQPTTSQSLKEPAAQPTTNQSFKFEVLAQGGWSSNAQRYETEEQARAAGKSLSLRWTAVEDYRVVPSTDPPNQPKTEPPPEEKPAPPPADTAVEPPQRTKIGDRVNWYEPTPDGGLKRVSGLVWEIRKDGLLGIRRGDGGYSTLAESQAGMVIRGNTTSPPPANLPAHQRIRKAIITREESLADDRQKSQELRDQLGIPAVSAVEPPPGEKPAPPPAASDKKILFIHVGDKPSKPTELIPSSDDEESVLRYHLEIRGRWGRKRADGFMSVDIVKRVDPKKPLPKETLLTMMNNKVSELKVMPGAVVKLIEQPWTVSRTGVERTSLLSGRTVHTETVK